MIERKTKSAASPAKSEAKKRAAPLRKKVSAEESAPPPEGEGQTSLVQAPPPQPASPESDMAALRANQPRFRGFESGHRACQGCGEALAARMVMEAAGPDVMVANATGCLEVFSTPWPQSAWRVPWIHSLFENSSAVASGIEAALKAQHRVGTKVLAFGGDGGTYDIGFQSLSGMLERTHDILYVCFDNEAYMNTGIQRSSSTPHAATTTTSPSGKARYGKRHLKKDLLTIVAAHGIPYAASASVAYPADLRKKVRHALSLDGPKFLLVHCPCPLGWGSDSERTIELARLAVQTGLFPLIEMERAQLVGVMTIRKARPVIDYLSLQRRFKHLFNTEDPRAREEREHLQALADHNIETYGLLCPEALPNDSEGADTISRGGRIG